jgi:hypothetical protein
VHLNFAHRPVREVPDQAQPARFGWGLAAAVTEAGKMALTRCNRRLPKGSILFVASPMTPCLAALYALQPGAPPMPAPELEFIIAPPFQVV